MASIPTNIPKGVPCVVAEKPKVARAVLSALGGKLQGGFGITGAKWVVTHAIGHLLDDAPPERYVSGEVPGGPGQKSRIEVPLPLIVDELIKVMPEDKTKADHTRLVKQLMLGASEIYHVGDWDREGQRIVDTLIEEWGIKVPIRRVKVVNLNDPEEIRAAFRAAEDNAKFKSLSDAGKGRSWADWEVGMNFSMKYRAFLRSLGLDVKANIGRVMSTVQALVVDRDEEIRTFKPITHYLPKLVGQHAAGEVSARWEAPDPAAPDFEPWPWMDGGMDALGRITKKPAAQRFVEYLRDGTAAVLGYTEKKNKGQAPLGLALADVLKLANSMFGINAGAAQKIAQGLYETHGMISYIGTDGIYLPESQHQEAGFILSGLFELDACSGMAAAADAKVKSRIWDDVKMLEYAHHSIVPTGKVSPWESLSEDERNVFLIVATRYIQQFMPVRETSSRSVRILVRGMDIADQAFEARSTVELAAGWKAAEKILRGRGGEIEDEDEGGDVAGFKIPVMAPGDQIDIKSIDLIEKTTTPPAHFTDGTLLEAMVSIHRFVKNPMIAKVLKETEGIGTERTRAPIIEKLIDIGYLERKKGKGKAERIIATEIGAATSLAHPSDLRDPGMTAIWESALSKVARGELSLTKFKAAVKNWIIENIEWTNQIDCKALQARLSKFKSAEKAPDLPGSGSSCPKCKVGTVVTRTAKASGKAFLACSDRGCDYMQWPDNGPKMKGDGETCAKCQSGTMKTRTFQDKKTKKDKPFLSCSAHPKCDNVVWS